MLRPQLTDSFEAKLHATIAHHNIDVTLFRRTTDDIWSHRSELSANGVLVTRPFNFGTQSLTGGEIAARGPLARGLRYVLTANAADQGLDRDGGGPLGSRHNATWSLTGQLEYKDGTDGRRGADRVNLTLRYFGANDTGFIRCSAYASASMTWSHAITDRLSSVLTVAELRLTPPRELVSTSLTTMSREVSNFANPRVTFSLTWSFRPPGQGPQMRQQQPSAGRQSRCRNRRLFAQVAKEEGAKRRGVRAETQRRERRSFRAKRASSSLRVSAPLREHPCGCAAEAEAARTASATQGLRDPSSCVPRAFA